MGALSKEEAVLKRYLSDRKILIADPSAASRSGLFKVLHELGAPTANLVLVNTFEQAREAVMQARPHVVIVEFDLGKRCGMELLQTQREQRPAETKECIFGVVTCNSSQTAVARAAEEDIDLYILKPYTIETVRKAILQAVFRKLRPSEYVLAIDQGKNYLQEGKMEEAEKEFERAGGLDPSPSLACYYQGHVKALRQLLDLSRDRYQQGLEYNRIHYKCMVGLYEHFIKLGKHVDAYQIVKKISQYFPANPKRLSEVLRLAVMTSQFEDIEKYYNVFINIDERDETLVRYVCAALVVCGKHYLNAKASSRALELFKKAAATGQGRAKILREIVVALVEHSMPKECAYFMDRFPPELQGGADYALLRLFIADAEGQTTLVINQGRDLMRQGLADERLYTTLIKRGVEAKLTEMAMDEIMNVAVEKNPDKKVKFEDLLARCRAAA